MNSATSTATAAPEAPETPVRGIDLEALKRLDDEVAANKRAKAEREAIEAAKRADPQDETDLANMPAAAAAHFRSIKAKMEARAQQGAEAWEAVSAPLRERIGEGNFERWFKDAKPVLTANGQQPPRLRLSFPTGFIREQIEARYGDYVREAWRIIEPDGTLELVIQPAEEQPPKAAAKRQTATEPAPQPRPTAQIIQLPLWPEQTRGTPNTFLRGALFAAIQGKERRALKGELLACQKGTTIRFTGWQLDQSDLDVWEQAAELARSHPLGNVCHFKINAFLRALGRGMGKAQREWLKSSFRRLMAAGVEITYDRYSYGGAMLEFFRDDDAGEYVIRLNPIILNMYKAGWTAIDWATRQKLRRKPLALWLHGWLSSNAENYPVKVETLHSLSGSQTKDLYKFRQNLRAALDQLKDAGIITAWHIDPDSDLVTIDRTPSPVQIRHITKKTKPRKA